MFNAIMVRILFWVSASLVFALLPSCATPPTSVVAAPLPPVITGAPDLGSELPYSAPPEPLVFESASDVGAHEPEIHAQAYILVNANTGSVLAAHHADEIRGIASTQKLLTALIVAESGNLDHLVRIAPEDVSVAPSKLGVHVGDTYTRHDLLIAFLVKSSNDVAAALARDNAGSIPAFAARMNARARLIGATHSHFVNPHGLTASGQYSTARDLARIALVAHHNSVVRDAVQRKYYSFTFNHGGTVRLENTNELIGRMPECDGMKTGYTEPAGRCLVSSAHRGGREVILVQLGTHTKYIFNDGAKLMEWGLNN